MILRKQSVPVSALTIIMAATASGAAAQDLTGDLASSDTDTLRSAVETRYDAALAATKADGVVTANDPRYMWASEAKVQCAIAIGYLKSGTRDETSLSKCDYAYQRMSLVPPPTAQPPVAPPPQRKECEAQEPTLIFFDWDSSVPAGDAAQAVRNVSDTAERCNWSSFSVVGHTDLSGSNAYNDALSMRRATAIADLMADMGIDRSLMSVTAQGESNPRVPTEDGVRNPQNRRVEVTVSR